MLLLLLLLLLFSFSKLSAMQERLKDAERVKVELLKANRTIRLLQNKVDLFEEEKKIVSLLKNQLDNYGGVVYRNEVLAQENEALK